MLIELEILTDGKVKMYRRNYKNINDEELKQEFADIDWDKLVKNEDNIDTCFENIINETQVLHDKFAPLNEVSNRKAKYFQKPWIDKNSVTETHKKSNLYSKFKKIPNKINTANYKMQKNKVTNINRQKKTKYFDEYFELHKKNAKKYGKALTLQWTKLKTKSP